MSATSWKIEFHSGIPAYKQIIHHIQAAVAAGELAEGAQLPTIRAMHKALGVNPNTVARAYRDLQAAGVITTHQGSGCFVAPEPKVVPLAPGVRQAKIDEIAARLVAEARSHQIPLNVILEHIRNEQAQS